jgi:hypothetical protein
MKITLELNMITENTTFLNFWNYKNGEDVILKLVKDRNNDTEDSYLLIGEDRFRGTISDFVDLVKAKLAV